MSLEKGLIISIARLTDDTLAEFTSSGNVVVVLSRQSCIDCKAYDLIVKDIAQDASNKNSDIKFGKVDFDEGNTLRTREKYKDKMKYIPHTILYKDGREVAHIPDVVNNTLIRGNIKNYLGVDI